MKIFGSHMACGIQECILVESTRPSPESSLCSGPWNECAYKAVCAGLFPKGLACKAETIFFRRWKRECVCGSFYMQQHVCDKVSSLFPASWGCLLVCPGCSKIVVEPKISPQRDLRWRDVPVRSHALRHSEGAWAKKSLRCSMSRKRIFDPKRPHVLHKRLLFLPACFLQGFACLSCLVVDRRSRWKYLARLNGHRRNLFNHSFGHVWK